MVIATILVIVAVILLLVYKNDILDLVYKDYKAPMPVLSTYEKGDDDKMINGDFYVSTNGSDEKQWH